MAITANPSGDAYAKSYQLNEQKKKANQATTLPGGITRTYNSAGTSYTDRDASGNQVGGGLAGTESYGSVGVTSGGGSGGSSGGSGGGSSGSGISSYLRKLKEAQLAQTVAGLDKQRQASLSNLSAEKATIEPEYQKQKIRTGVNARQTARSFEEYMAQRGGGAAKSGIAGQGQLLNNMAYQGNMGALNEAEASALSDIARRVTGVGNAYESDIAGARAGVEAQYLQNYIQQLNADRAFNQANYQFDKNYGLSEAGLTGMLGGVQTMQGKQSELQNTGLGLQNAYQSLINQNYPVEQALRMAQAQASLTGTNLANDYQSLVNAGYPAREAAELAQMAANLAQTQKQTSLMGLSGGSGGGGGGSRSSGSKSSGSSSSSTPKKINATTANYAEDIIAELQSGGDVPYIRSMIDQLEKTDTRVDGDFLRTVIGNVPIDNWQYLPK